MNKKQIVKVSYMTRTPQKQKEYDVVEKYGIVIDEDRILLEDTKVACLKEDKLGTLCNTDSPKMNLETPVKILGYELSRNFQVSATRNVHPDIRAALEQSYTSFVRYEVLWKQLIKIQNEANTFMENIETLPSVVREARGIMSGSEFANAVYDNLTDKIKYAMNKGSRKRDYYRDYPAYKIDYDSYNKTIEIRLEVDIDKYFRKASFIYEKYDGTICFADNAQNDPNYKKILKEYSSPLPVKQKPAEGLSVGGDKDFLSYYCIYRIKADKPMTKEYAKKIANDFCKDKTRDRGEER